MKVILSVPDEGYSKNASCALYFISTFFLVLDQNDELFTETTDFR
jgi:hypothetical protein